LVSADRYNSLESLTEQVLKPVFSVKDHGAGWMSVGIAGLTLDVFVNLNASSISVMSSKLE
jgi:hypothetical protein